MNLTFTATRSQLLDTLTAVSGAMSTRTQLIPILQCVLIEGTPSGPLRMTGTDCDLFAFASCPGTVETPGGVAVNATLLRNVLRQFPETMIAVRATSGKVVLQAGSARATLLTLPATEFPSHVLRPDYKAPAMPWAPIGEAVDRVLWATASEDPSMPAINGLLWAVQNGILTVGATDRHRAARATMPVAGWADVRVALPARVMQLAAKAFAPTDDVQVAVQVDGNTVGLRSDSCELVSRLIDSEYPALDRIFELAITRSVVTAVAPFRQALRRAQTVLKPDGAVTLSWVPGSCTLTARRADAGDVVEPITDVAWEGEPFEIAFNASYLQDTLAHVATDSARFAFVDERRGSLIAPVDSDSAIQWEALAMPVVIPVGAP